MAFHPLGVWERRIGERDFGVVHGVPITMTMDCLLYR